MKTLFTTLAALAVSILLAVSFGHTSKAAGSHSQCDACCAITEVSPVQESNGSVDDRTISLSCPNCYKIMWATFKIGYGSTTIARCEHCYSRFSIRYSWPRDHKEPTIFEIKKI